MNSEYYDQLSVDVHADCVEAGWWDDPDRCLYTCIQLVSTEISEATEGARKGGLVDDHLPHRSMEEVEYADGVIRLCDLAGSLNLEFNSDLTGDSWCNPANPIGKQQLGINRALIHFANALYDWEHHKDKNAVFKWHATRNEVNWEILCSTYSNTINSFERVASNRGMDLHGAIAEKREYNRTRKDHTRKARQQPGGKEW